MSQPLTEPVAPIVHWTAARTTRMRPWLISLFLLLALGFQGTRGIWDPDEGRYTNVALNMLDSGDWVNPKRNDDVAHWTKPPVTYWAIAASVGAFGRTPWAARLPIALAYLSCIWLAWALARRLAPGAEAYAAVAYATMLLPFGAGQLVTTDFIMTALQTAAVMGFVEARFGAPARSRWWLLLMWVAFALAFMTKGPPALLPLLAIVVFELWVPQARRHPVLTISGSLLFVLIALPWYLAVILGHPGLLDYFLGSEVVARIATNHFNRHGEWYGWIEIYLPTLLIGTMPWSFVLWRRLRNQMPTIRQWRDRDIRREHAPQVLLMLWIALPLLVFCLARSRLPLYVLPLFVPIALLIAQQWHADPRRAPSAGKLVVWSGLLLVVKCVAAYWPTHKNAAEWADAIRNRVPYTVDEVVFVEDMVRYGLNLHLNAEIEKIALDATEFARFSPEYDESLDAELAEADAGTLFVAKQDLWPKLKPRIERIGAQVAVHGQPYQGRLFFSVAMPRPNGIQPHSIPSRIHEAVPPGVSLSSESPGRAIGEAGPPFALKSVVPDEASATNPSMSTRPATPMPVSGSK